MTLHGLTRRYLGPRADVATRELDLPAAPTQSTVRGMGPLQWMLVRRTDGIVEHWTFDPMPRLYFGPRFEGADVEQPGGAQLWISGGAFQIDADGFRNLPGVDRHDFSPVPIEAARVADRTQDRWWRATHGGHAPTEAYSPRIVIPRECVDVGTMDAVAYRTRRDAIERPYEHPMEHPKPRILVGNHPVTGSCLLIHGGGYRIVGGLIGG